MDFSTNSKPDITEDEVAHRYPDCILKLTALQACPVTHKVTRKSQSYFIVL